MLAFRLLRHSVLMLLGARLAVARMSLPYLLVILASQFAGFAGQGRALQAGNTAMTLPLVLIAALLFMALAVSWHRHVLLDDAPRLVAPERGWQMLSYLGTAMLIALAFIPPVMITSVLIGMSFAQLSQMGDTLWLPFMLVILFYVLANAMVLRLSVALPGAALRSVRPIRTAWRGTRGHMGSFLLLAALAMVAQAAMSLLPAAVISGTGSVTAALATGVVVSWAAALLALSMLTTMWGYFVEGRDLR